jgi:rSAM/selenodomain-associated transferase 2
MSKISVIVPLLNEEKMLPRFLEHLRKFQVSEVICVDGGSNDRTSDILLKWMEEASGECRRKVLSSLKGRALQMNEGAKGATGEVFFFLHVDSLVDPGGPCAILNALKDDLHVGGAFRLKIDSPSLFLRMVAMTANARSHYLSLPYGDQGYFVRRNVFEKLGGFKNLPLMEDVEFVGRLKKEGPIVLLNESITTSARRWVHRGYLSTTLRNFALVVFYFLGAAPEKLAQWYYNK